MQIFIASDHTGFLMKKYLLEKLSSYKVDDFGAYDDVQCSYPIFAKKVSDAVAKTQDAVGILICGSGVGMSIAANRHKNIRAALCFNEVMAKLSRAHNDANIIIFGARIITNEMAEKCVSIFLASTFEGGRHIDRIKLLDEVML